MPFIHPLVTGRLSHEASVVLVGRSSLALPGVSEDQLLRAMRLQIEKAMRLAALALLLPLTATSLTCTPDYMTYYVDPPAPPRVTFSINGLVAECRDLNGKPTWFVLVTFDQVPAWMPLDALPRIPNMPQFTVQ